MAEPPPPYPGAEMMKGMGAPPQPPPMNAQHYPPLGQPPAQQYPAMAPGYAPQPMMHAPSAPPPQTTTNTTVVMQQAGASAAATAPTSAPLAAPTPAAAAIIIGGNCPRCHVGGGGGGVRGRAAGALQAGTLVQQQDVCMVWCLVVLCLITSPFFLAGLVFLCCIPCAVERRCTHCGYIR